MLDDDFLVGCMGQLSGKQAQGIDFRTPRRSI